MTGVMTPSSSGSFKRACAHIINFGASCGDKVAVKGCRKLFEGFLELPNFGEACGGMWSPMWQVLVTY